MGGVWWNTFGNFFWIYHFSAGIDTLDDVGCFGLTELGYGNNAVEMETTAVYDKVCQVLCEQYLSLLGIHCDHFYQSSKIP